MRIFERLTDFILGYDTSVALKAIGDRLLTLRVNEEIIVEIVSSNAFEIVRGRSTVQHEPTSRVLG